MPKWLFLLAQASRQLWVRVALYSLVGVVTALLAALLGPWVPEDFALKLGTSAVDDVLSILASSMLAVATFSLAVFVNAYTAISSAASPRAAALLVADGRAHGALATFVGAFIYAVVGIFALQTGYYGEQGRVIVFFVTLGVLAAVLVALLRWIDRLSKMGRVDEVIDRVAKATRASFSSPLARRLVRQQEAPVASQLTVDADQVGYVSNIDLDKLQALAVKLDLIITVDAPPGEFVYEACPLLRYSGQAMLDTKSHQQLRACWVIAAQRTFTQDPRLGMSVLGEISAKALSPAINDPGTALNAIASAVRLLTAWVRTESDLADACEDDRLRLPPLRAQDMLDDAFAPIAHYGAGSSRVGLRLQTAFGALMLLGDEEVARAARVQADLALKRAMAALTLEEDRERVRREADRFGRLAS